MSDEQSKSESESIEEVELILVDDDGKEYSSSSGHYERQSDGQHEEAMRFFREKREQGYRGDPFSGRLIALMGASIFWVLGMFMGLLVIGASFLGVITLFRYPDVQQQLAKYLVFTLLFFFLAFCCALGVLNPVWGIKFAAISLMSAPKIAVSLFEMFQSRRSPFGRR